MQNSRIFVVQPSRASILLSDFEEQNLSNLHGLQAAATSGPVLANKVRTALREQVEWKLDPAAAVGKTNGPPRRIYDPLPERTRIPEVLLLRAQSRGFISPLLGCPPSGWPEIRSDIPRLTPTPSCPEATMKLADADSPCESIRVQGRTLRQATERTRGFQMNLAAASFPRATGAQTHLPLSDTALWFSSPGCLPLLLGITVPSKLGWE
nr:uncharacterized protein LOC123287029 isoform X1 [Equus asinus]XP_044629251.1 uncharacterized protein LOC123287029 isoform X1 [Equus asinus]